MYYIVTNNPMVAKAEWRGMKTEYLEEGTYLDVLLKVREYTHKHYSIITHPLAGSIKPNQIPYRSIIVSDKPVDEEEMLLRIKALLRRAQIVSDRRIVIGEVVLDYDSFTVSRNDEVQELPQKEFLLLYKLLSYPGKIFTRIQLMDEIWGYDSESDTHTVDVHIGRLRDRFRDNKDFKIVTMRGVGYKVVKL